MDDKAGDALVTLWLSSRCLFGVPRQIHPSLHPTSTLLSKYGHLWLQKKPQDGNGQNAKLKAPKQFSTNQHQTNPSFWVCFPLTPQWDHTQDWQTITEYTLIQTGCMYFTLDAILTVFGNKRAYLGGRTPVTQQEITGMQPSLISIIMCLSHPPCPYWTPHLFNLFYYQSVKWYRPLNTSFTQSTDVSHQLQYEKRLSVQRTGALWSVSATINNHINTETTV